MTGKTQRARLLAVLVCLLLCLSACGTPQENSPVPEEKQARLR